MNREFGQVGPEELKDGEWIRPLKGPPGCLDPSLSEDMGEHIADRFLLVPLCNPESIKTIEMDLSLNGYTVRLMGKVMNG